MERFHPTTTAEEARALTVGCLQAMASGWSLIYMRPARVQGLMGNQTLEPDLDRMVSDAADLAARITQAVDRRKSEGTGIAETAELPIKITFHQDGSIERMD